MGPLKIKYPQDSGAIAYWYNQWWGSLFITLKTGKMLDPAVAANVVLSQ